MEINYSPNSSVQPFWDGWKEDLIEFEHHSGHMSIVEILEMAGSEPDSVTSDICLYEYGGTQSNKSP